MPDMPLHREMAATMRRTHFTTRHSVRTPSKETQIGTTSLSLLLPRHLRHLVGPVAPLPLQWQLRQRARQRLQPRKGLTRGQRQRTKRPWTKWQT